jgi:hypothetical protein
LRETKTKLGRDREKIAKAKREQRERETIMGKSERGTIKRLGKPTMEEPNEIAERPARDTAKISPQHRRNDRGTADFLHHVNGQFPKLQ